MPIPYPSSHLSKQTVGGEWFVMSACCPYYRSADGDVSVEAGDDGGVDGGRHGDLGQRQQRRNRVRVHVRPVRLAQSPASKEGR